MDFMPYIWGFIGLLLIASEFIVPGFVIFFFGIGAILNGVLTGLIPGLKSHIWLQIFVWLGISGLSLFVLRRFFSKIFKGRYGEHAAGIDYRGEKAVVIDEISPDNAGRIKFQGTTWTATSYNELLKSGEIVEIVDKDNLTFVVTKSIMGDLTE